MALEQLERNREAIIALQRAIQLNPEDILARYSFARQYRITGTLRDAITELVATVDLKPEYEAAWFVLGEALSELSSKDIAAIEPSLRFKPGIPLAYYTLGYVSYRMGRLSKSKAHLDEALRLNPRLAGGRNLLGLVYFAQKKNAEAIMELERAFEMDPN